MVLVPVPFPLHLAAVPKTFSYHKTTAPMLWAFVALAVTELLVVHLFVSLRWPALAWPLFALTALSILGLVWWILGFRRHPHCLTGEELVLRTGSLRTVRLPLAAIERVSTQWPSGEHRSAGALNLVPVAFPNRLLRLKAPLTLAKRPRDRIAVRVDDGAGFDAAMRALAIPVT